MPEVIDDTVEKGQSIAKPVALGAAGVGVGSLLLGPGIGMSAGTLLAGTYVGGTEGTIISVVGSMFGLASLVFGNPFAGGMTAQASTTGGQPQGVK